MNSYKFLEGRGEMKQLTRSYHWENTSIGSPDKWPQSLRTTVSIILNSRYPMFLWWGDDLVQFYNDAYRPSLGENGKHPAALGCKAADCWQEIWPVIKPLIDDIRNGEKATWSENQLIPIYRNGKLEDVYWTYSYSPVIDESGSVGGVLVVCNETTSLVLSQKRVQDSEKNLRNIILQAPVAMCIFKESQFIVEIANERMYELWGKTQETVLGRPIFEALPEAKGQGLEALLGNVYTTGKPYKAFNVPVRLPRNGGVETVYVDFVYEAFRGAENNEISGVMAVALEVTEQVIAREKIEESEQRLNIALDAGGLGTFELDYSNPDELITNKRFDDIFGFDDHVTRHEFAAAIHPDDIEIRNNAHKESLISGRLFYEVRLLKKSNKISWIRIVGKILYDENEKPERLLGILQDITEQKNLQQQKDNFIAMASHELKTPVTSIKAYGQVLEQMLLDKGDENGAAMMARMDKQVIRLTNLIGDLLNITKINTGKFEYFKSSFYFNTLVDETVEDLQRTTVKHKLFVTSAEPVIVFADKERLGQVITNFISNAIKYSPDADRILISTTLSNHEVIFCVEDFGIGIDEENQGKVFEQFFRVNNRKHQSFQGLGLGLYISSEIIKREGGKIWVSSQEGKGSEFFFSIPVSEPHVSKII